MCRLLDGQREGQLTQKLDIDTLNTKYLPEKLADLKNFIYNQQVLFILEFCCKNSLLGQAWIAEQEADEKDGAEQRECEWL